MKFEVEVNDWICFYNNGKLRIAEVRYIKPNNRLSYRTDLYTNYGIVNLESVIEVRQPQKVKETK